MLQLSYVLHGRDGEKHSGNSIQCVELKQELISWCLGKRACWKPSSLHLRRDNISGQRWGPKACPRLLQKQTFGHCYYFVYGLWIETSAKILNCKSEQLKHKFQFSISAALQVWIAFWVFLQLKGGNKDKPKLWHMQLNKWGVRESQWLDKRETSEFYNGKTIFFSEYLWLPIKVHRNDSRKQGSLCHLC